MTVMVPVTGLVASPDCETDSIVVTVVLDKPPHLYCPDPQEFFTCFPDTFCFTVEATDPELQPVTINVISGNATIDDRTVCVMGDSSESFTVVLEAVDACGNTDTCSVPVTIFGNRPPYVNSADDFFDDPVRTGNAVFHRHCRRS